MRIVAITPRPLPKGKLMIEARWRPSEQAVQDFEKVAKDQKLDLDYDLGKRLDEMAAAPPEETKARLAEIAEFLGQTGPSKGKW